MRKRNLLLTGILLLIGWATIQFYLFANKPQFPRFKAAWFMGSETDQALVTENGASKQNISYKEISARVEFLEQNLSEQAKQTQHMLKVLKKIGKFAHESGKSISEVIAERKYLHSLADPPIDPDPIISILLFACNRVTVKRALDQLFKFRPNRTELFPVVVSQDCGHQPTRRIIESYGDQLTFIQQPDQSDIILKGEKTKKFKGYYKISRHYGWALNYTFNTLNYDTVIIVEDDLDIAPDFFEYFRALYPILKSDPSIYCVSAWNDNGKSNVVENDPTKLYRSDFFPGLGWMLTKDLWQELQTKWPKAFWDDWIREPAQRKNRACIRPELSRTKTFGKKGVSNGLFYEKHLKFMKLNTEFVPFTKRNLSYLLKENYDVEFLKQVYNSQLISVADLQRLPIIDPKVHRNVTHTPNKYTMRVVYNTREQFKIYSRIFDLMKDFKSGVPRTGYQGVVSFIYHGYRVYLAPKPTWTGYNTSWN